MQVDLFLHDIELFVHLDFEVVPARFNLGFELQHLLLLGVQKGLTLIGSILLSQVFDSLSLVDLHHLKLLSVVNCLFNTLVNGNKLLIVLHFFEFS